MDRRRCLNQVSYEDVEWVGVDSADKWNDKPAPAPHHETKSDIMHPMKFFNIAGPCVSRKHYMLPATVRLSENNIERLIRHETYFVIHAPRQVGKTTAILDMARHLNEAGDYVSAVLTLEVGAAFPSDIEAAERAIVNSWQSQIEVQVTPEVYPPAWSVDATEGQIIGQFLKQWATHLKHPLVIFFDEIDALRDNVLISVLRQLRAGYWQRPNRFPISLALIGLRYVIDLGLLTSKQGQLTVSNPIYVEVIPNVLTYAAQLGREDFSSD